MAGNPLEAGEKDARAVIVETVPEPDNIRDSWVEVRDSWVGEPPASVDDVPVVIHQPEPSPASRKASIPPPLPPSGTFPAQSGATGARGPEGLEQLRAGLMQAALTAIAVSDYGAALIAAEAVMRDDPGHEDAVQCAAFARKELRRLYEARLGSRELIPRVVVERATIDLGMVDSAAIVVLGHIDGVADIEGIIAKSELPDTETLRTLSELFLKGIISLDPAT